MPYVGQTFEEKPCKECNIIFKPNSGNSRYCSKPCSYMVDNRRAKKKYLTDENFRNNRKISASKHGKIYRQLGKDFIHNLKLRSICTICGFNDHRCLVFHHKDPKKKEYNIPEMVSNRLSLSKIKGEISKCVILCANCHRILHYDEMKSGKLSKR